MRTPLTSIRGALGLLSAGLLGNVDAKAQNLLRIASTNTERLIRLINDILDLERMESGRAPLKLRRCSMYDLAREAVDTMTPMADGAGVRLELVCNAPRDSIYFDADSDRILQVMTNLLSNAIKFSPPASTVSAQIDSDANSLLLKVIDEGRGIPPDKLESVFDRFQQVESSDASKKGGTGLGLAICRSIIQQHGGRDLGPAEPERDGHDALGSAVAVGTRVGLGSYGIACLAGGARRGADPGMRRRSWHSGGGGGAASPARIRHYGGGQRRRGDCFGRRAGGAGGAGTRHGRARSGAGHLGDPAGSVHAGAERLGDAAGLKESPATAAIPVVILSVIPPTDRPLRLRRPRRAGCRSRSMRICCWPSSGGCCGPMKVRGGSCWWSRTASLRSAILAGFAEASLRLDHASSLRQAVDRCLVGAPDLMILDLTLPDGDGFSLVDWLRRQPTLQSLPLVVYSSRRYLRSRDDEAASRPNRIPRQGEAPAAARWRSLCWPWSSGCATRLRRRFPDGMRD